MNTQKTRLDCLINRTVARVEYASYGLTEPVFIIRFTDGTSIEVLDSVKLTLPPPRAAASDRHGVTRTRIVCADGHSISVQASVRHYSQPRDNRYENLWLYESVECGYPETPDGEVYSPEELEEYREHGSKVYPYTPIGVVAAFITAHGGAVSGGQILREEITNY
jgi:hypothetical protein